MKKAKAILFFMVLSGLVKAATFSDSLTIQINGKAYFAENPATRLEDLMIINLRTSQGSFGKADGTFSVFVQKNDTLLIASTGYENTYYSVADSAYRNVYTADIKLKKLSRVLKEVTIFSPRDLESIYSDIKKLGYNKKDFEISGVDALNSPITFLYQEFSRVERVKRHNAERINEEKRKELLRQLLSNYVAHDIINLDDNEFDDFIDFCHVPEQYMKEATQYDFCIFIKQRFEVYNAMKGDRR